MTFDIEDFEAYLIAERPMMANTARKRRTLFLHTVETYSFDVETFMASRQGADQEKRKLLAKLLRDPSGPRVSNYKRLLAGLAFYAGYKGFEIKAPPEDPADPKAYDSDEWVALRGFRLPRRRLMEKQLRGLMDVAYYSGMRPGEIAKMRRQDLDPVRSRVYVAFPEKGGRRRWLPVEREMWSPKRALSAWLRALDRWDLPDRERLWWSFKVYRNGREQISGPATADTFRNWMNRYVEPACQVDAEMHRFRHTRAVALYNAGLGLVFIKEYLGHKKLETTWNYLRSLIGRLEEEFHQITMPGIHLAAHAPKNRNKGESNL